MNPREIPNRVQSFYDSLVSIVEGKHLRCTTCNHTEPADGRYFRVGWPRCCGYTMRLEDVE